MNKIQEFILILNQKPFIISLINNSKSDVYVVGGAIRDIILNKPNKDIDLVVRKTPIDILTQQLQKFGKVDAVGKSFGVLKFVDSDGLDYDIALPRTDKKNDKGGYRGFDVESDENLPIEADLERRDAKMNAMAINLNTGKFIDPLGGLDDIEKKQISAANSEAFSDDPLRMLRIIQFSSRFGFTIEPKTMQMIIDNASRIKEIPPERILTEFEKIITKGNIVLGVQLLNSTGLFKEIFGNEINESQISGRNFNSVKTMAEFLFLMMNGVVQNPSEFYLSRFSAADAKRDKIYKELQALDLAFNSDLIDQQMIAVKARSVVHNMFKYAPQTLESQILPNVITNAAQELLQGKYPKTINELAVNGNDLMERGLQGKALGDMQKSILIMIYADKIRNNKDELLFLINQKSNQTNESADYSEFIQPKVWNINGNNENINYFVLQYDEWNHQSENNRFNEPSRESVLRFLEYEFNKLVDDETLKKQLYWKLIDREVLNENTKKMLITIKEEMKKVNYSAVVLDDKSRELLIKVFNANIPNDYEVIAHHMTIKMGALDNREDIGKEVKLTVTDYAIDDKVFAVGVKGYPSNNPKPHITIGVNRKNGGKPFMSNNLTGWIPIGFSFELTGKVSEV